MFFAGLIFGGFLGVIGALYAVYQFDLAEKLTKLEDNNDG